VWTECHGQTLVHSWVKCFYANLESFQAYGRIYPRNCILLVDTVIPYVAEFPMPLRWEWDPVFLDWSDFKNSGTGVSLLHPDQDLITRLVFPTRGGDHIRL